MKTNSAQKSAICMMSLIVFTFIVSIDTVAQVSHKVSAGNYTFSPTQLTINAGDTVIWENIDGSHNVNGTQTTFPLNRESFGNNVGVDWTYKYVFTKSGTYDYQCDPHIEQGMTGKVIVNDNSGEDAKLTVEFTGMTPHIGQKFTAYLKDAGTKEYLDTVKVSEIGSASFDIIFSDIKTGSSYTVDFYADLNGNENYDVPPVDHAWRLDVNDVQGDVVLNFSHNTNFTDIFAIATEVGFAELSNTLQVYPNPATANVSVTLSGNLNDITILNLYAGNGILMLQEVIKSGQDHYILDISRYNMGVYFLQLVSGSNMEAVRIIKQ